MKILKAKNKIDGCETLVCEVDKLPFSHSVIDAEGFVKLYNSITETMNWPLILFNGKLKYGNSLLFFKSQANSRLKHRECSLNCISCVTMTNLPFKG